MRLDDVVQDLKKHEGFEGMLYNDHLGNPTIGYGALLPLTKGEATLILRFRLNRRVKELSDAVYFLYLLPEEAQQVVANMSYQMGVQGVVKFKKMWKALEEGDFEKASIEGLDSLWARQTPNRAKELMGRLRALGHSTQPV